MKFFKWPGPGDLWTANFQGVKFEVTFIAEGQGWALIAYDEDGYDMRREVAPDRQAAFKMADEWCKELQQYGDLE